MVDLNNNTRRGQLSKKEAQSHRGGEGGRERETKSDSGGEKTFRGVLWVEMWARGAERGQMAGKRQRGAQTNEKGKKRVSLC